ncbi:unnamed protein product [Sphagnum balticum]
MAPAGNVPSPEAKGESTGVSRETTVREMGMMHLVAGFETYKTASGVITQALGRIDENVSSEALKCDAAITLDSASSETLAVDLGKVLLCDPVVTEQTNAWMSNSDTDADDDNEGGLQLVEPIDDKSEF